MFIKIYQSKVPNTKKSLKKEIEINMLLEYIKNPVLVEQISPLLSYRKLNFWDLGIRATKHIKETNNLTVICENYMYIGKIIRIIDDPAGEIGDVIGWNRGYNNRSWKNVITRDCFKFCVNGKIHPFNLNLSSNFMDNWFKIFGHPWQGFIHFFSMS